MEDSAKKDILNRLSRIEGQVKGVERMIQNENNCREVLVQIVAIRAAINKVGTMMLGNSVEKCFNFSEKSVEEEQNIQELISILSMFIK